MKQPKQIIGGSVVKNLPAMQEIRVQSLGREDLLGKEMVIYSSILAWKIPWTEEPGGSQRVRHDLATEQQQPQIFAAVFPA